MAVHQAPLSLRFSRQEYWSGLPFPSPMHACMLSCFSRVRLCATLWTSALQAPLSTGFSRQENWSGLPFPSPRTEYRCCKNLIRTCFITLSGSYLKGHKYILGEGNGKPLQYSCLENPVDSGGLLSIGSHRVRHDWSDLACMHALEKEMAAHSSVLAWRIPGTEEPGGLPSMGLRRVGHNWNDLTAAANISYLLNSKILQFYLPHCF